MPNPLAHRFRALSLPAGDEKANESQPPGDPADHDPRQRLTAPDVAPREQCPNDRDGDTRQHEDDSEGVLPPVPRRKLPSLSAGLRAG